MLRRKIIPGTCVIVWCAATVWGQEAAPVPAAPGSAPPTVVSEVIVDGKTRAMIEEKMRATGGMPSANPGGPQPPVDPSGRPRPPDGSQPPGAPGGPGQPGGPGAPGGRPGEPGANGGTPGMVKRSDKPSTPPNPEELKVRPDQDGKVQFQFRGQSWPDILEWFGEIAGMSVDWQELPGDYVNITTQRGYKVDEIRDLLNRLLLARGFTMLRQEEFLAVVKCEQLNVGLVPQVSVDELETRLPHEFVRVLFELDWMLASEAVTELEPLLSENGALHALSNTNRMEAMDAVVNLREIGRLLAEEQKQEDGQPRLVREFVLQFARATDVKDQLAQLLGQSTGAAMPVMGMNPEQMQQMQQMQQAQAQQQMQQMQQMQMQQQQQMPGGQPGLPGQPPRRSRAPRNPQMGAPKEEPVRMVVSQRRNSLVVQAPPDKMAIIADAIKLLDVREPGAGSLQAFLGRMQVYRLAQLDPKKLVASLQELGGLDPTTRLEVDEVNRAIIAYASPADHFTIRSAVEKLDSSARRVEVIPLRNLAADEVAGTIQYLMAGTGARQNTMSDYDPYGFSFGRSRNRNQPNTEDSFRVEADMASNRLLVRANDIELEEVVSILTKLGEIPLETDQGVGLSRVLDVVPGEDPAAFFQRLERDWKSLSPHPLIVPQISSTPATADAKPVAATVPPVAPATSPATPEPAAAAESAASPANAAEPPPAASPAAGPPTPADQSTPVDVPASEGGEVSPVRDAALPASLLKTAVYVPQERENDASTEDLPSSQPAPIVVSIGADGRLIVSSRDPAALAAFEEFAARVAPPAKDYAIFRLKSASATWVVLNLEDYFKDEDEADGRRNDRMMSYIFGYSPSASSEEGRRRLSKRRPLKFISDIDTNTILVQNADPQQLQTIKDLIELYDVPEPTNSQKARVTKLFTIKFSRASLVAETIKDAYRDLLSTNDRALQEAGRQGRDQQRGMGGGGMTIISPFGMPEGQSPSDSRTSARFDGKLSIGIDDVSNTLLVSTEGDSLMSVIGNMIEALDEAARPVSEVRVVKIGKDTDGTRLREALARVLGKGQSAAPPTESPGPHPGAPPGQSMPGGRMRPPNDASPAPPRAN